MFMPRTSLSSPLFWILLLISFELLFWDENEMAWAALEKGILVIQFCSEDQLQI